MSDKKVFVYIDLEEKSYFVGTLWSHFSRGKETSDFEYSKGWLNNPIAFSLTPSLYFSSGKQVSTRNTPLLGAFGDSAPDTWGRILMRRYEAQIAKEENRVPRTLNEIDYLLYVADEARQGSLRFKIDNSDEFQYPSRLKSIPPLINLNKLLSASEKLVDNNENEEDLRLILAPGSSLGGARPKASVIDKQGNLCIAKFPKKDDYSNNVLWEAVALTLAKECGLNTQEWWLEKPNDKNVLIVKRFDRKGKKRIPFLSAMNMLNAVDNDSQIHSYLDIADVIRQYGASSQEDLKELWKRIVFSILISNTDDHLRNHGFLYDGDKGWRLSPLYDVNPSADNKRVLNTYISENDNSQSLDLALEVSDYFELNLSDAKNTIAQMQSIMNKWAVVASKIGLSKNEIAKMEIAFNSY